MLQLTGNGLPGSNRVQVAVNQPVRELWFIHERVQTPPLQEAGQAVVVKQLVSRVESCTGGSCQGRGKIQLVKRESCLATESGFCFVPICIV